MNTGWKRYRYLIEVYEDTGVPTGNIKLNVSTDDDYVSDVWNPDSCPYPGYNSGTLDPGSVVITAPEVFTLSCSISPSLYGSISISPSNNSNEYLENTEVVLTAVENIGYDFVEFQSTSGVVNGNTLTLTMDSNKSVVAIFVPEKRRITVQLGGGGVSVKINTNTMTLYPGIYEFDYGTVVTVLGSVVDQDLSTCGVIIDEWGNSISGGCAVLSGDYNKAYLNSSPILANSSFTLLNNVTLKGALFCDTSNCI